MVSVVDSPEAHRVTLRPSPARHHAVVLALPRPPLCRDFEPARFERVRAAALARLAARVGSGDGPAPLVDLEDPAHAHLPSVLERLTREGVRAVVLFGAADRPEFARELAARFDGAVQSAPRDALLESALGPELGACTLGEGLWRVDRGHAAPSDAQAILWRDPASPWPFVCPTDPRPARPLAHDPERRCGAHRGLLPPEALAGDAASDALRRAWAAWSSPAQLADTALALEPALEAALTGDTASSPPSEDLVAVTGPDGSGKSTHVDALARRLTDAGLNVGIFKLYRQGAFLRLADDLSARTGRGAPLAGFKASRVVKLVDSLRAAQHVLAPLRAACDVVVLDRWTETHLAAASSQLGWSLAGHGALAGLPEPVARAWLLVDPDVALARIAARGTPPTADEHAAGLRGYAAAFDALAVGPREVRLDATHPPEHNAAQVWRVCGDGRRGADRGTLTVSPPAPPEASLPETPRVVVGAVEGRWPLGDAAHALLTAAGEVSFGFRLEATAAHALLDVREGRAVSACAPLWPGALVRLYPELGALTELARLLDREVDVIAWRAPRAADFPWLPPRAATRFAALYGAALSALAAQHGWPEWAGEDTA